MKKVLLIYVVLIAGIIIWYYGVGQGKKVFGDSKVNALKVSKHSPEFNQSMEEIMGSYYEMTDSFIKDDTAAINQNAAKLRISLDSLKIEELKKDSDIYETAAAIWDDAKTEINGMISDPSLQAKRESLNLFSDQLYTLLNAVHYDLAKLYWMQCSSAFGEDTPGGWLTKSEKSQNPYGKENCGEVKKIINPADSSKK
jgi:hypothetical protein